MLSINYAKYHIQALYAGCRYAECRYPECHSTHNSILQVRKKHLKIIFMDEVKVVQIFSLS